MFDDKVGQYAMVNGPAQIIVLVYEVLGKGRTVFHHLVKDRPHQGLVHLGHVLKFAPK